LDWIPSLHLGDKKNATQPAKIQAELERSARIKERRFSVKLEAEREEQEKEEVKAMKLQEVSEPVKVILDQKEIDDIDELVWGS